MIPADAPLAVAATTAVQTGDVDTLSRLLREHPGLVGERIGDETMSRTLLHALTDWPANVPDGPAVVTLLVEAGADVNARFAGPHAETPLHWAASSDDVAVLDALLDSGADIEAAGAVIAGGTPLSDAVAFGQWEAARRLVERGARTQLWHASALGLVDRVQELWAEANATPEEVTGAFGCACHGGQCATAQFLLERGAGINWSDGTASRPWTPHAAVATTTWWPGSQGVERARSLNRTLAAFGADEDERPRRRGATWLMSGSTAHFRFTPHREQPPPYRWRCGGSGAVPW